MSVFNLINKGQKMKIFFIVVILGIGGWALHKSGNSIKKSFLRVMDADIARQNQVDRNLHKKQIALQKDKLAFEEFLKGCQENPEQFNCKLYLTRLISDSTDRIGASVDALSRATRNQSVWHSIFGASK